MAVWCVLCYQSVFFLTNGVCRKLFTTFFTMTICVYDFCETVLVKNTYTLPRYDLNVPSKMLYFYAAFLIWHCSNSLVSLEMPPKNVEGAALELQPGLTCPGPCEPGFLKTQPPCQLFFAVHTFPEVYAYFIDTVC